MPVKTCRMIPNESLGGDYRAADPPAVQAQRVCGTALEAGIVVARLVHRGVAALPLWAE